MSNITGKTVLVTGASDGSLGAALAQAFTNYHFFVFAAVRDPSKALELSKNPDVEVIQLDVTDSQSIKSVKNIVEKRTDGRLDVLVNNAGAMFIMPLLDSSIEKSKEMFEVNVWGVLAMAQAFSGMLVKSKGVILNIASIGGAVRMAWQGVYNSSKAASRWLSETLRIEMQPLGVRVITAMVGEVETKIYQNNRSPLQLPPSSYYHSITPVLLKHSRGELQKENEKAEITAENLVQGLLKGRNGHVWRGGVAGRAKYAHWALPERLFEWLLHSNRGVYQIPAPQ